MSKATLMQVYIDMDLHEEVEKHAKKEGMNKSEWVRKALREQLKRERRQ